jgi:CRISPR-associated endoribonuclease Cas6
MNYHYIKIKVNTKHKASYFTGSMLRGAMGYALKKVTCINPSYNCEGCFAQDSCLYYDFYEKQNHLHNYRFDIELGSGKFDFGLYLFEEACGSLAYVLSALEMTLREAGLTKENYTFENFSISVNGQEVFDGKTFKSLDITPKVFKVDSFCPNVKVKLLTPLRIKKHNKFLRDDVELEDILRSIYQREQEIFHGKKAFRLEHEPSYTAIVKALQYKSLTRNSSRQKKTMKMDGIVGELAVMGLDEESYRLLKLGEVIAVGKQTVMGLGQIKIEGL